MQIIVKLNMRQRAIKERERERNSRNNAQSEHRIEAYDFYSGRHCTKNKDSTKEEQGKVRKL